MDLKAYNHFGFLPKPEESKEAYSLRANQVVFSSSYKVPEVLKKLYHIEPNWVKIVYSDDKLSFFEAGCTWIDEHQASVQLKKHFLTKERFLHLYDKEEVLAHELVHVVRAPLQSEKYEEFFAYYTSSFFGHPARAFLGPLFAAPLEVWLFLLSLFLPFLWTPFLILPLGLSTFFASRLLYRWSIWYRCMKKVGLPLMIRLTDSEIDMFSKLSIEKITAFIEEQKKKSFRWSLITFM